MDIQTIRRKTDAELNDFFAEQRAHLADLRFRLSARELKNVNELRLTRQTIARVLTVLSERRGEKLVIDPKRARVAPVRLAV
ncbi:MAG: 50S ribosomal protein L29 [Candidatus Uhrbacteria bacterium]